MTGLEVALPYIMAATAAVGAVSAIQQGQAAKKAGEANAQMSEMNARSARMDAAENARRQRRINRKKIGSLINANVSMDLLEDNVKEAELMALGIEHRGEITANDLLNKAAMARFRGAQAMSQSYGTAATTLMQGAGSMYTAGAFGSTSTGTGTADMSLFSGGGGSSVPGPSTSTNFKGTNMILMQ